MRIEQEIDNVEATVPHLSSNLAIYPAENNYYVIHEKSLDLHIKVNNLVHSLLLKVDGKRTVDELTRMMSNESKINITPPEIYKILYGTLADNGIILSNRPINNRAVQYLSLKVPVFKKELVLKISHILAFLFKPGWFGYSFLTMSVFLAITYLLFLDWKSVYNAINPLNIVYFFIYSFLITVLHELGHVTACRRFGSSHGHIGFAFYLFTPVFYADVSEAWKLKASERIIIDMAGIYMEFIIALVLAIIFFLTSNILFLIASFYVILRTITNLNPFFRFDAYWAVSDYLDIPNLRRNSNTKLLHTIQWLFGKNKNPLKGKKDIFLLVYALISTGLLLVFIFFVLIVNPDSIFNFPKNLYSFFKSIITGWDHITFDWFKMQFLSFIIPLSFYIILFRTIIKNRKKIIELFNY
jgi:putative peptide zinc metalloprotease protein